MKRLLYILSLLPLGLNAQNMYNVASFFENELIGTARYVGMGGSMSALGADLSTIGTNPAGMAMFRSNNFVITGIIDANTNLATYEGTSVKSGDTSFFVGNTAFVLSMKREDETLQFLNFGLGYRRKNNLNGAFEMYGASNGWSQQFVIDQLYKDQPFDCNNIQEWMYNRFGYNWLSLLAGNAYLGDTIGNFLTYPDTTLVWRPDELAFYEETRGGVDVVDLNLSANFGDRIYLGATVGVSIVDYSRYSEYREIDAWGDIYLLENNRYLKGSGFDLKLGAIIRPFKYSPFKVGVSVHTPTWYNLTEYSSAAITDPYGYRFSTADKKLYGDVLTVQNRLRTPWRVNASMSYTFGSYLALNAEYEYADYTKSKFTDRGQVSKAQNEEIEYNMAAQHIVRVGAELNMNGFAMRAGYNYHTAPFAKDAYKYFYNASVTETSTDYMNRLDKSVATVGCGYRKGLYYFDVAYMLEMQKSEFYPFYDFDFINPGATVRSNNHSVVATVGLRF